MVCEGRGAQMKDWLILLGVGVGVSMMEEIGGAVSSDETSFLTSGPLRSFTVPVTL